jgi:hypothetical protein
MIIVNYIALGFASVGFVICSINKHYLLAIINIGLIVANIICIMK